MTELDELKQRLEIEELRGRLSAAEKQISILTDTLATLTEIQTSDRLGSYINSQVRLLKAAEFLNSVSDGEKIAPQLQRQSVEQAGIRKAELDEPYLQDGAAFKGKEPAYRRQPHSECGR